MICARLSAWIVLFQIGIVVVLILQDWQYQHFSFLQGLMQSFEVKGDPVLNATTGFDPVLLRNSSWVSRSSWIHSPGTTGLARSWNRPEVGNASTEIQSISTEREIPKGDVNANFQKEGVSHYANAYTSKNWTNILSLDQTIGPRAELKSIPVPMKVTTGDVRGVSVYKDPASHGRTLIFVLKQKAFNRNRDFWGLGDMVRGMVRCFQLAQKYHYDYTIDMRYHPVSQVLKIHSHGFEQLVDENVANIPFTLPDQLEGRVRSNKQQVMYIWSNGPQHGASPNRQCIAMVRKALQLRINSGTPSEHAVHVRLGDIAFVPAHIALKTKGSKSIPQILRSLNKIPKTAAVMSDSQEFKLEAKKMGFNNTSLQKASHFGITNNTAELSLIVGEFMAAASAKYVHYYSAYPW
eukprot:CAMPEP_0184326266 /NCGR_PEP_ID=MMETSP1049-20130417/142472_1 /TAXON_ID=77928 /ORGANISM="Proteomonas sulcata, Strain CCMP704" /LENGTH=406 /DNA_ID=CAMNT_0026648449 /DNA_START=482 /DNA_END=1699 /DNA_ORIENTATION=-